MKRNYPILLTSQFLSAFGDNAILALILGPMMVRVLRGEITSQDQQIANIFYTSVLFVPYVLLAPLAGYFNDRFSKTTWLAGGTALKLVGTAIAAMSLTHGAVWMGVGYFVIGIGAAVYSPAKYGILPEILPVERLVKANGTVELLTLVAILTGSISGSAAFDRLPLSTGYAMVLCVYGVSTLLNLMMQRTPSHPEVQLRQSLGGFMNTAGTLLRNRRLARVLLGTSTFWICGAMMKMNFQPWGLQVLHFTEMTQVTLLGLWLAIGIMVGSVLAGQLYPVGELRATRRWGWLLAVMIAVLGSVSWLQHHGLAYPRALSIGVLILAGLFAGLFLIPLNAALQAESHQDKLGKTIATQNGFENLAMLAGSVIALADVRMGFDPSQMFLALAVFTGLVAVWLRIPAKAPSQEK